MDTASIVNGAPAESSTGGWYWDSYNPHMICHYGDEGAGVHTLLLGGSNGHLYQYLADEDDNGIPISLDITTPSRDQGEPRLNKYFLDSMLDSNTDGVDVEVTPYINNNTTQLVTTTINNSVRQLSTIPTSLVGAPTLPVTARNISINLRAQVEAGANPLFYIWEPRFAPETALLAARRWTTAPSHFNLPNYKHLGTCKITHVSTVDLTLIVTLDGVPQSPITITNSSGAYVETYFRTPVYKGKLYAFDLRCSTDFRLGVNDTWFEIGEWDRGDSAYVKTTIFGQEWV